MRGFIGTNSTLLGKIVSVTSKEYVSAIGNSLAPSDMCPAFADGNGGDYQKTWDGIWQPKVQKRLHSLIEGNLTLTLSDVNLMPYLCGFESQITGRLSPFCDVFTDEELKMYQYSNDLRYYYGTGPGTELPQTMMTPFLNSLIDLFKTGPGKEGLSSDGHSNFQVPSLMASFLNDGQLIEIISASGVFDEQQPLSATEKDDNRLWIGSRFVTMRGTIAFERLNCQVSPGSGDDNSTTTTATPTTTSRCRRPKATHSPGTGRRGVTNSTYVRIRLNDQVYPVPSCRGGPGSSCPLAQYSKYIKDKYASQGNWVENCNITTEGAPTTVRGASFFTDLAQPHLRILSL